MTTDIVDARALLRVAPDDYVAERTRLVKQARADGARTVATAYQALKRPSLSLWAALAAADDAVAVRAVIAATSEVARVQAGGSDAGAVSKASQSRRKALESLVDAGVKALARFEAVAEARRAEIRGIIDQLSRHEDLAEAWLDGTLRDLPDDSWGFGAFADLEVTAGSRSEPPRQTEPKGRGSASPAVTTRAKPQPRPSRVEHKAKVREARKDVADAKSELNAAERRLDAARRAVREAEKEAGLAAKEHQAAEHRHQAAAARLAALDDSGLE